MVVETNRLGRRPGNPDTRGHIAETAWGLFLAEGYEHTSMRAVARAAGCDPKLVRHHFGSKAQLFVAGMQVGVDTDKMLRFILDAGLDGIGVRFITALTSVYESPAGEKLVASFRASPELLHAFWAMIAVRLGEVGRDLLSGGRTQRERVLAQVQVILVGFLHARYVDPTPPSAALSRDEAVRIFGGLLQRVLSGVG